MNLREAAEQALDVLEANKRSHYYCEDRWYSCPKHPEGCTNESAGDECDCGADKANAQIDKATTALRAALAEDAMQRMTDVQQETEAALADQATYGMSITLDGKRIDPAAIYKEREPVAYRLSETDIYDFAGWLTTRPGVLEIGTSKEAGPMAEAVGEYIRTFSERFAAPPAPTWTDAHWTKYERGIVATERERIAAWVEDMCAGLDAKTIANGIRNGGNDDIGAFEVRK